jgi:hypothetical protein
LASKWPVNACARSGILRRILPLAGRRRARPARSLKDTGDLIKRNDQTARIKICEQWDALGRLQEAWQVGRDLAVVDRVGDAVPLHIGDLTQACCYLRIFFDEVTLDLAGKLRQFLCLAEEHGT